jgi:hypothetical protein
MGMSTELEKLKKLEPVKFPSSKGAKKPVVFTIDSSKGKSTKEIIAEMKRLSKKDIYVAE